MQARWQKAAAGRCHTLLLDHNGAVCACGSGEAGHLGTGRDIDEARPVLLSALHGMSITQVAAGFGHSLFLDRCGRLFTCGQNSDGQLGLGDCISRYWPTLAQPSLFNHQRVTAVVAGGNRAFCLTADSRLVVLPPLQHEVESTRSESSDAADNWIEHPDPFGAEGLVSMQDEHTPPIISIRCGFDGQSVALLVGPCDPSAHATGPNQPWEHLQSSDERRFGTRVPKHGLKEKKPRLPTLAQSQTSEDDPSDSMHSTYTPHLEGLHTTGVSFISTSSAAGQVTSVSTTPYNTVAQKEGVLKLEQGWLRGSRDCWVQLSAERLTLSEVRPSASCERPDVPPGKDMLDHVVAPPSLGSILAAPHAGCQDAKQVDVHVNADGRQLIAGKAMHIIEVDSIGAVHVCKPSKLRIHTKQGVELILM